MLTVNARKKQHENEFICQSCGCRGTLGNEFLQRKIPSAQRCVHGSKISFKVKFPGEDKAREFKREPSQAEILAILETIEDKAKAEKEGRVHTLGSGRITVAGVDLGVVTEATIIEHPIVAKAAKEEEKKEEPKVEEKKQEKKKGAK